MAQTTDVAVVGGGVIGVAIAWRLAARGAAVTVIDPDPGAGATGTAAGMLAPVTELHYGEEPLLALNIASAQRYADFVAQLEDETGHDVGYRRTGTVVAAWDGADLAGLRDLHAFQRRLGLSARMLTAAELRELEPATAPGLPGGVLAADDHAVDPRRLHAALLHAATVRGTDLRRRRAVAVQDDLPAVVLDDGTSLSAGTVVVCGGAWSSALLPQLPVRPVKGQTLRLRTADVPLTHVLRGSVRGHPVYLVPRLDGEVVVGASSEEAGFDLRPRAGVVHDLLRDAQALLPDVAEMELVEVSTGLRPATPDNAPIIGAVGGGVGGGVVAATGHYRNGVLLAPVTADAVVAEIVDGAVLAEAAAFGPARFAATAGASR
jgi:glycine oxidase